MRKVSSREHSFNHFLDCEKTQRQHRVIVLEFQLNLCALFWGGHPASEKHAEFWQKVQVGGMLLVFIRFSHSGNWNFHPRHSSLTCHVCGNARHQRRHIRSGWCPLRLLQDYVFSKSIYGRTNMNQLYCSLHVPCGSIGYFVVCLMGVIIGLH